tara:strand:- start:1091 stop:2863 length:1773 start_codon:yes stop_codon:yes gene_type:complete
MDILKLAQYVPKSFEEKPSGKGWINYGDDNLYPQYLIDLYQKSGTHNALCTSIAYMIFGEGLKTDSIDARLKMEEWSLDDEIRKACLDLKIQGGFALEIIYSMDRTTISKVRHLPFENIRSGEANNREEVDFYYYSRDWEDRNCEPEEVHSFDPSKSRKFPVQILYMKPFSVGSFAYPSVDYQGSISYIELDKEIASYHISNIRSGLAPSYVISFLNGSPPVEERNRIRNDIESQLAGATNAGKFIITYSDQPDRKPSFEPFPLTDADKQYQFLSTETTDKIMVGHRVVSPAMFGVKTSGQLGSTQELEIASQLFERQVIVPFQKIVDKAVKSIFRAAGILDPVKLHKNPPIVVQASQDAPMKPEQFKKEIIDLDLAIDTLIELGEEVSDEWECIDSRRVVYKEEDAQDEIWNFARTIGGGRKESDPSPESKQDNKLIKIRYAYMPKVLGGFGVNPTTGEEYKSRDFCTKMVNAGNKVWAKEQIELASKSAVNRGWGEGGANTYDLFLNHCDSERHELYKGGGSCQHFWQRITYLRKNNKKISVNQAKKIMREAGYDPMEVNSTKVAKRPRDMVGRGFVDGRGNWTTPRI